jgi:hypothetical protein
MSEDATQTDAQYAEVQVPVEEVPAETAYQDVPAPNTSFASKLFAKKIYLLAVVAVVVVVIAAGALAMGTGKGGLLGSSPKAAAAPLKLVSQTGTISYKGAQVPVKQTFTYEIPFNGNGSANNTNATVENLFEVTATCSWTDDYSGSGADDMNFELVAPDGTNTSKDTQGSSGSAILTIKLTNITDKKVVDNSKGWVLKVTCVSAGGAKVGPFGFLMHTDAGNDWATKIDYKYYGPESKK